MTFANWQIGKVYLTDLRGLCTEQRCFKMPIKQCSMTENTGICKADSEGRFRVLIIERAEVSRGDDR